MKKTDNIIRQGDRVRIVRPMVVTRVGYPLGIEDGIQYVRSNMGQAIDALVPNSDLKLFADPPYQHERHQIERALALIWLKQKRYGGPVRSVHVEEAPSLEGRTAFVLNVKTRYTGTYNHGFTDWQGEHTPAYLGSPVVHRIAELDIMPNESGKIWSEYLAQVEVINLEKLS